MAQTTDDFKQEIKIFLKKVDVSKFSSKVQ